jgi:hypothetical protein
MGDETSMDYISALCRACSLMMPSFEFRCLCDGTSGRWLMSADSSLHCRDTFRCYIIRTDVQDSKVCWF